MLGQGEGKGKRGSVAIATLGCKVNQAESDQFARAFARAGLRVVEFDQSADAYIINSCAVTHVADRKSRQLIRQARRTNAQGIVVATGCYAAVSPDKASRNTPIDLVVPNHEKANLVALVLEALQDGMGQLSHGPDRARVGRTRSFVKIQDGCDSLCSFCVIPYARGRERSVPIATVVEAVREQVADGHKELVLTGVHVGTYGHDLSPRSSLRAMIKAVLGGTAIRRLHLSSIEPWNFDLGILEMWPSDRLCRHFHLALQSGSDTVLGRMRRPYDTVYFARLLDAIRAKIPEVAITTDVIVGFPGESDREFAESLRLVADLDFALVHVFPYSQRPRTAAARMPDQVSDAVKRARVDAMLAVAAESAARFRCRFHGGTANVLYQRPVGTSDQTGVPLWEGLTDHYLRVLTESPVDLSNRVLTTRLIGSDGDRLRGILVEQPK